MKNNDDLFQLIKTLSEEEKHFFSVYASRVSAKGDSNYVRLFTAIDQQDVYDENIIRKKFQGQSIERFLASSKHELYGVILRSIHAQYEESTAEARLRQLLHYAEVLAAKGLEKMARQQVAEAKRLAEKHELLAYLPEILHLEFAYMSGEDREQQEAHSERFLKEYQDVIKKLENLAMYERLNKQVRFITQNIAYGHSTDHSAIDDFLRLPEIKDETGPKSIMARYFFHQIHALCAFNKRDFEGTYVQSKKVFEMSQQYPDILQHDTSRYISLLHHYSNACSATGRLDEMRSVCKWLRAVKTNDQRLIARIFQYAVNAEYNILLVEGNHQKAEVLAAEVEKKIATSQPHMERVFILAICGQTAYVYYLLEQYNKSLRWLNEALNQTQVGHRDDITLSLRILEILLHYELNNHDLVDYRLKSLLRYLSPKSERFVAEITFINGIRKITGVTSREQLKALLVKTREAVCNVFEKAPATKRTLAHFNLLAWLNGKIDGVPMRDRLVFREEIKTEGEKA
ncbi:MAG: hypothetical protein FD123_247 [Bacteroidetes bacterium]|nr:MAG: hypothetical protein FD123_247 [Bacteroidota bacterium]